MNQPSNNDLKPCPFCGSINIDPEGCASIIRGTVDFWDDAKPEHITHRPACDDCGATTNNDWNIRTQPTAAATATNAQLREAWQPIETAPNDRLIQVTWIDDPDIVEIAKYKPSETNPEHRWFNNNSKNHISAHCPPTHWRERPTPLATKDLTESENHE